MSNCDNWEDDWENDDDMDAKLKANIEETKRKEIQHLVDNAEEQLIEDLFLTPLFTGTSAVGATVGRSPSRKPPDPKGEFGSCFAETFSKGWVEQKQINGVNLETIKGTKLYWFLLRCFDSDMTKRCLLYI